jgi:Fe-S-cluster-containing hydrogenase component 2/predicted transcriptional regulator
MAEKALYQQLAKALGAEGSQNIAGIFEVLADEKEAKVLMAASPPATIQELSEKTGIEEAEIERMINPLFLKGLLYQSKKPDAIRYYRVRRIGQMHDATAVMDNPPQKMLDLWKDYMTQEWYDYRMKAKEASGGSPASRVIPVNVSIDHQNEIIAFDDVAKLMEKTDSMAVTRCSCRVIDGACGKEVWNCMQFGKAANYAIERGTGRRIDMKEAINILKKAEEEGLVHVVGNVRSLGHIICNCCKDCCMNWPLDHLGEKKVLVNPSRFLAAVDAELCSSCETCLDRCPFDAISMEGEDDTALVDEEKCMGCGVCLVTCPEGALSLKETRSEEFVPAAP